MHTPTELPTITSRPGSPSWWRAGYWLATAIVAGELGLGGIWDIARLPFVTQLVTHLGYPSYFLVLLGIWKVLGALVLLIPGRPLLKEWAYAGAFFTYTGAIASHLTTGYARGEVGLLAGLTVLTVLSWALRPPSRRMPRPTPGNGIGAAHFALRRWFRRSGPMADLHGQGEGQDEVDQHEGERWAEVDRIPVQLGADDNQPQ